MFGGVKSVAVFKTLLQVFTMFDFASCDYELEQFLPHLEHLKRISQYQQQQHKNLPKSKNMFIQIYFYIRCSDS